MNYLKILLSGAFTLPVLAQGAWTLINDFNDVSLPGVTLIQEEGTDSGLYAIEDPTNPANLALFVNTGQEGIEWAETAASLQLPTPIGPGDVGTIYLRFLKSGHSNNWYWAVSDVPDFYAWGDMTTVINIEPEGNLEVKIRNGGGYNSFSPPLLVDELDVWYEFWKVIDYDAGSYSLYFQGPADTEPRLLMIATDPESTGALFRHVPVDGATIKSMIIKSYSGDPANPNTGDIMLTDDVYFTMADDISNPRTGAPDPRGGGAWTLINNFNDAALPGVTLIQEEGTDSALYAIEDPTDPGNLALFVNTGQEGIEWAETAASLQLPTPIGPGDVGTIYLRFLKSGHSNNWYWAVSDVPDFYAWGDMTTVINIEPEGNLEVKIRNGGGYNSFSPPLLVDELDVWYEFWKVIDYDAGSYSLYFQGPTDTEPWLLNIATDPVSTSALFRHVPVDGATIKSMIIKSYSGDPANPNTGDIMLTDDVWFTMADDISNPRTGAPDPRGSGGDSWGGYPIVDGLIDTGDWLGWLYAEQAPWMFSYSFSGWIYAPDPGVGVGGVWTYILK